MVKETVHIVLPYWEDKRKGLVPRAKRLFDMLRPSRSLRPRANARQRRGIGR